MNLTESYKKRLLKLSGLKEEFNVINNTLEISEPYDKVQKININGKIVYILFGNVDYYNNKQSILAIKRKSDELKLDHKSYKVFLKEFETRFNLIPELSQSNVIISVETTSPVTREMASVIHKPFIENGFNKNNPAFKMKDVDISNRNNVQDLFTLNAELGEHKIICILDDFLTSGTTFKNAFDKTPDGIQSVGVCLFKLNS